MDNVSAKVINNHTYKRTFIIQSVYCAYSVQKLLKFKWKVVLENGSNAAVRFLN